MKRFMSSRDSTYSSADLVVENQKKQQETSSDKAAHSEISYHIHLFVYDSNGVVLLDGRL